MHYFNNCVSYGGGLVDFNVVRYAAWEKGEKLISCSIYSDEVWRFTDKYCHVTPKRKSESCNSQQ